VSNTQPEKGTQAPQEALRAAVKLLRTARRQVRAQQSPVDADRRLLDRLEQQAARRRAIAETTAREEPEQ
jgi:hypothetical protein